MSLRLDRFANSIFAGNLLPMSNQTGDFPTGAVVSTSGWPQLFAMRSTTMCEVSV